MVVRQRSRHRKPPILDRVRGALQALVPADRVEPLIELGLRESDERIRLQFYQTLIEGLREHSRYLEPPVGAEEFLLGERYLNKEKEVYPEVLKHFIRINDGDEFAAEGGYSEAVFTGAIGVAKTTLASWTNAYQLYRLLLMRDPHREFGLVRTDELLLVFQSLSATLARQVDYDRFRHLIYDTKFFNETAYTYNPEIDSELQFPRRIFVRPVSGAQTAAIGQNVFGGLLDEVNYMQVVEKSMRSVDAGTYDQAVELYNSLARRRKSRFMQQGRVPGIFCIVSSKRYPGQFTDQKAEEAAKELKETGKTSIYIYDVKPWEVLPEGRFLGPTFPVFIGDGNHKPRILEDDEVEQWPEDKLLRVPIEYRKEFEKDIINALREIGGVSTMARHPFVLNIEAVASSFGKHESILSAEEIDFVTLKAKLYPKSVLYPEFDRFMHIDLGLTGDAAGVACGCVPKFVTLDRGNITEIMPYIHLDFVLRVCPPKNDEIQFHKIRQLIYTLCENGIGVRWVTLDSFQSADTIQILRGRRFSSWRESMDRVTLPYDVAKTAFYDGRVAAPEHAHALKEWQSLERDPKTGKIDHPMHGSKDLADAMTGVIYGLTFRSATWATHDISPSDIPKALREMVVKAREEAREAEPEGVDG